MDWYGLYREGWNREIVPEAFGHPAKFARGLIRGIYEHAIEEGWLSAGDTVLDPFGGVALGALDAMYQGLWWYGVELEGKFVALGWENIALWNTRYSTMPRWGKAAIVQGDSRRLAEIVQGADAIVSSPPFLENNVDIGAVGRTIAMRQQIHNSKPRLQSYGTTPGQLGGMKEGDYDAVVSSPPYASVSPEAHGAGIDLHKNYETYRASGGGSSWEKFTASRRKHQEGYGTTPGQLGQESEATFWSSARQIVEQCYLLLRPGGHAIWVVKAFVRDKKRVDFPGQWRDLCEAVGFRTLHEHKAHLIEDRGAQHTLFGEVRRKRIERKSFFRRLAEKKGCPRIDWEIVLCMEKPR